MSDESNGGADRVRRRDLLAALGATAGAASLAGCQVSQDRIADFIEAADRATREFEATPAGLSEAGVRGLGYPDRSTTTFTTPRQPSVGGEDYIVTSTHHLATYGTENRGENWAGSGVLYPMGVLSTPTAEIDGNVTNPVATTGLSNLLTGQYGTRFLEALGAGSNPTWRTGPNDLGSNQETDIFTSDETLDKSAFIELYRGDLSVEGDTRNVVIALARAQQGEDVVVLGCASFDRHPHYGNRAVDLVRVAAATLRFEPSWSAPSLGLQMDDLRLVQRVEDTTVTPSSVHNERDPDLVETDETAALFDLHSVRGDPANLDLPAYYRVRFRAPGSIGDDDGVVPSADEMAAFDLRQDDARAILNGGDPAALFHRATGNGAWQFPPEDNQWNVPGSSVDWSLEVPVFQPPGNLTAEVWTPAGYRVAADEVSANQDYEVRSLPTLKVGFIRLWDKDDRDKYGGGSDGRRLRAPVRSWQSATAYLQRVYPGNVVTYLHTDQVVVGGGPVTGLFRQNCTGSCVIFRDMKKANSFLNSQTTAGSFPDSGRLSLDDGVDRSDLDWSNGFDVVSVIVPSVAPENNTANYYDAWGVSASGLAFGDPAAAVSVQGASPNGNDVGISSTIAQEIGHYFQDNYLSPSGHPMAQRRNIDDEDDQQQVNGKPIDPSHARNQNSNRVNGGDSPGVVSTAYDLKGGFFAVEEYQNPSGSFGVSGPGSGDTSVDQVPSYMSYTGDDDSAWADARIHQQLIDSGWSPSGTSGSSEADYTISGIGGVTEEGTVQFDEVWALPGSTGYTDREGAPVRVELFGPDGEEPLEVARVPREVQATHGHGDSVEVPSFTLPFDRDGVTVRTTLEDRQSSMNPITRSVRDAVARVPDAGFDDDPEEQRARVGAVLDDVAAAMANDDYAGAADVMDETVRERIEGAVDEYESMAIDEPSRSDLTVLLDEMVSRLDGLAGGGQD